METRSLGGTGLKVTVLGYGAMQLRGPDCMKGPDITEDRAAEVLNAVLDAGINVIDTARGYGLSEGRIGRHISHRRSEYVLATKSHCEGGWNRTNLRRELETSLELLATDHVDVLQLHNPTPADVREGRLVEALQALREEGLTRAIGISTFLPDVMEFIEMGVFETFQFPYSCLQQRHREAMERAAATGAGMIARGAASWGGPRGKGARTFIVSLWDRAGLDEVLGDMSPGELLIRYSIAHPDCHTNVVGSTSPEHIRENASAARRGPLPAALLKEITGRVKAASQAIRREKDAREQGR